MDRCWSIVKEEGQVGNGQFVGFTRKRDKVDTSYYQLVIMFNLFCSGSWIECSILGSQIYY